MSNGIPWYSSDCNESISAVSHKGATEGSWWPQKTRTRLNILREKKGTDQAPQYNFVTSGSVIESLHRSNEFANGAQVVGR